MESNWFEVSVRSYKIQKLLERQFGTTSFFWKIEHGWRGSGHASVGGGDSASEIEWDTWQHILWRYSFDYLWRHVRVDPIRQLVFNSRLARSQLVNLRPKSEVRLKPNPMIWLLTPICSNPLHVIVLRKIAHEKPFPVRLSLCESLLAPFDLYLTIFRFNFNTDHDNAWNRTYRRNFKNFRTSNMRKS